MDEVEKKRKAKEEKSQSRSNNVSLCVCVILQQPLNEGYSITAELRKSAYIIYFGYYLKIEDRFLTLKKVAAQTLEKMESIPAERLQVVLQRMKGSLAAKQLVSFVGPREIPFKRSQYSRLRLIRPHQNTNFLVRINRSDELRVPFNIVSQWSMS